MKNILKLILTILVLAFIVIQFFRPEKNLAAEIPESQITAKHQIPESVMTIFKNSCYDCHSNTTAYPWYWHVQPVAWFLDNHIRDGKRHLNFSEFSSYLAARQYKKLKEIAREVKDGDMPMYSYTIIHRGTSLSDQQKLEIQNWVTSAMKEMENQYPADSLKSK